MKAIIWLVVLVGFLGYTQARITLADVQASEWESFKLEFNKSYDEEDDGLRMRVFQDNKRLIAAHNQRWANGEETYEMGVNEFTDLLEHEFDSLFTEDDGIDLDEYENAEVEASEDNTEEDSNEHDVDWRTLGAVTPVKHQGHFNNSWAFAAAGVVESRHFVAKGRLVPLSAQNLVDCAHSKHKRTMNALKYIKKKGGLDTQASYPYRGPAGKCKFERRLTGASIKKYYQSAPGNEKALAHNVANGPVTATISRDAIRFFKSGVFHNTHCSKSADYALLIVGYGTSRSNGDYWLLKTSLGTSWGDKGYMRLARNRKNICGIANRAYYPVIK